MDILYIIGKDCSKCDNFELRASLRSIEKYGKNVGKVYVAGYCPEWLSDEVVKIPCDGIYAEPQNPHEKHINITSALLYAIDHSDIGEEFLVSMDDHFYVRDVDFDAYPYYCKVCSYGEGVDKTLLPSSAKRQDEPYRHFLVDTNALCLNHGISNYNFSLHRNMHCSRKILMECRHIVEQMIAEGHIAEIWAFTNNWQYTHYGMEITHVKDVKINNGGEWWKTDPRNTEVFSTVDFKGHSGLHILIEGLFPNKCKYELNKEEISNE